MAKISKNRKAVLAKYNPEKEYSLEDASKLVKEITFAKFDSSVDVDIRLGVDPKKSDQMVRGVVALPHGIGKDVRVLVLCTPDKVQEAKDAGAEHVGLDDFLQKIEGGWTDIDVIICTPTVMAKVGKLGKILGPRGLMPNPKSGTVTLEVGKAVKEVKAGKIDFKIDKQGIIHCSVGKASFSADKIRDNVAEMINVIAKLKPASAKGTYFQSITLSTTMSPGITVDTNSVAGVKQ
ncbi:large subunit ribosomal protein L1 [Chryseolinea serpens]|jgi:large subunit ribosomal protein L1|uniref:Large ribosomal subunit protein uL1 n=1 Tax=Chryseolinea serpens TaxID=947013 RepID=A0A1M5NG77_9BACT|nr:50S ribosomal protein L1 [Chryseolinea serpens]SHG88477.1 large subunit ribosomal protein L1 [Chryseolinea serpens]